MSGKRKAVSGILATLLLMSFLTLSFNIQPVRAVESGLLESPWPMFQHDAGHTGRSISIGPQEPEVKWIFDDWISDMGKWSRGVIRQAPVIGIDGTIYLGAREGLYAINPDGTLKWLNDLGWVIGTPAIDKNGVINVVSGEDVFAIRPDGSLKWRRNVGSFYGMISPIIGDSGSLYLIAGYITSDDSYHLCLFEIQPDGTKVCLYEIETYSPLSTSVAIDSNGIIYFGCDNTLYAINPNGTLNWQIGFTEGSMSTPTISPEGTIYVSAGKRFHSINSDGEIIWSSSLEAGTLLPAAIGPDGTIYTSAGRMGWPGYVHCYLYAFNPEGSLKWERHLANYPISYYSAPIVDAEGNIYVIGSINLRVYNSNGDEKWNFLVRHNALSLSLSQDGTLYVPSYSIDESQGFLGYGLYAFGTLIEDWAPTCSVKLRKEGVEISEIDVGEFLDIYVGDSTDDTGIKQVRFSSDDVQEGIPTGEWTEWYVWGTSSGDWDASTKIKSWVFATDGAKEVWAEVKDDIEQTDQNCANIVAKEWSFAIITDLHIGRGYPDYGEEGWNDTETIDQEYYLIDRLQQTVDWIIENRNLHNIRFVAVLGDIADSAEHSEFDKAKAILDRLDDPDGIPDTNDTIPYVPVIGNHDVWPYTEKSEAEYPYSDSYFRSAFIEERLDLLDSYFKNWESPVITEEITWGIPEKKWIASIQNYAFEYNEIKFIILDCVAREPTPFGKGVGSDAVLWDNTLAWLKENLESGQPTVIFSHNPMVAIVGGFGPFEINTIGEAIAISNAKVLANFAGHVHGFYPFFMDANKIYVEGVPESTLSVTTEALMVASNEPIPKGIIRIVKVKGDEITIPFKVEGEFRALNPSLKIDEERLRFGEITVEFNAHAFTKRFTSECPGRYAIDYGDGTEIEWSEEVTEWYMGVIFKHDYEGGKEYPVTLFATGFTPDGQPIIEKIEQRIHVSSPFDLGIIGLSPIDFIVTDPDGFTISKEINEIPGAIYTEEVDFNGDGELDDIIAIPNRKLGDYIIDVIPDATTTDTYSLLIWPGTMSVPIVLVDEVQVMNIPDQPYIIESTEEAITPILPATIDFDPDTLAFKSGGQWVTVYIELPVGHGYDVCNVSLEAIMLNDCKCAETSPTKIGDYDDDGIADLMVKFDRQILIEYLKGPDYGDGDMIELTVTGEATGTRFEGFDTIQVISKEKS